MSRRAVVLLSGGLDSILAVRILQEQGIEVDALNLRTTFACCQDTASHSARRLGVRLTVLGADEEYLDVVRHPKYGYGRGANPCVDCRIYMFRRARQFMLDIGASFVASGELLGQRPKSQKRRDLNIIAAKSGLDGLLLRPLSARLLTPTIPEQTGVVDRSRLYAFVGRSRKGLIQLAHSFGFADDEIPSPSTGCSLTEKNFATRVFDLIQMDPDNRAWDFQLLQVGRHVRFNRTTKIVIGRREAENDRLEYLATRPDSRAAALLRPHNFSGPLVLVVGEADEHAVRFAGGLQLRFAGCEPREEPLAWLVVNGQQSLLVLTPYAPADAAATL